METDMENVKVCFVSYPNGKLARESDSQEGAEALAAAYNERQARRRQAGLTHASEPAEVYRFEMSAQEVLERSERLEAIPASATFDYV